MALLVTPPAQAGNPRRRARSPRARARVSTPRRPLAAPPRHATHRPVLPPGTLERDLARRVPALLSRARALLRLPGGPADRLAKGELAKAAAAVSALHLGLVGERTLAKAATYDEAAHLGAYLLWWWPQSYAKVRAALALRPGLLEGLQGTAPLLDLGAGPGPAAFAALDHLAVRGVRGQALLLDRSGRALAEAKALSGGAADGPVQIAEADLARGAAALPPGAARYALITAAHLLSELPEGLDARARFAREAAALLAPGGVLLLLEPALRETGRALLQVRDRLLANDSQTAPLAVLAPCFTQRPCPALAHPRDWCTAEQPWEAPPHVLQLSRELGLHAEAPLQFAAVILGAAATSPAPAPDVFRVVGLLPPEKGKKRLFVCNDGGRVAVARLERDRSPANETFDNAGRGDVLRLTGLIEKGDGKRLGPGATVEPLP